LALAQALINDPELLVLDEPAEGMDLLARNLLHDVLKQRQSQGRTAILVSHSLGDVQRVCDHVAVLNYGEIAFAGRLDELFADHADEPADLEDILKPLYEIAAP
jgi:ABC-2 type transport system ATP-binding protein